MVEYIGVLAVGTILFIFLITYIDMRKEYEKQRGNKEMVKVKENLIDRKMQYFWRSTEDTRRNTNITTTIDRYIEEDRV